MLPTEQSAGTPPHPDQREGIHQGKFQAAAIGLVKDGGTVDARTDARSSNIKSMCI